MSRTTRLAIFLFGGVVSHIGETTSMSYSITRDFHWEQKFGQQHDLYKIELEIEFEIAMDIKKTTSFFTFDVYCLYEKFENTKGVIRGRNSKTDRQYIGKMKRKKTKKMTQNNPRKLKIEQHEPPQKGCELMCPGSVSSSFAPLVAHVV